MRRRAAAPVGAHSLTEALARAPRDHYVVWTGHACGGREGSLRARATACVTEVATPVPLRILLQRAATLESQQSLDPDAVRSAVRTHQGARPASYLLVRELPSREFVAVTDIPWPAGGDGPIAAGDLVIDAQGWMRFTPPHDVPARAATQAPVQ